MTNYFYITQNRPYISIGVSDKKRQGFASCTVHGECYNYPPVTERDFLLLPFVDEKAEKLFKGDKEIHSVSGLLCGKVLILNNK